LKTSLHGPSRASNRTGHSVTAKTAPPGVPAEMGGNRMATPGTPVAIGVPDRRSVAPSAQPSGEKAEMTTMSFLLPFAAALALASGPACAQHDAAHDDCSRQGHEHGSHATHAVAPAAAGIAEGTLKNGVRTVEISVTDEGFVPSKVKAKKGEKVRLVVTRRTDSTCAKEIVVKDHGIKQPLPLDRPVKVLLRSIDVLHDFYVPEFRAKMDMVPGTVTYFWLTPTRTGTFDVLCFELCGIGHYAMRGTVVVEDESDYQAWLAEQPTFAELLAQAGSGTGEELSSVVSVAEPGTRVFAR